MNTVLVRYGDYVHTKRYEKKNERKTRSESRDIDETKSFNDSAKRSALSAG